MKANIRAKLDQLVKLLEEERQASGRGDDPVAFWVNTFGTFELDRRIEELTRRIEERNRIEKGRRKPPEPKKPTTK